MLSGTTYKCETPGCNEIVKVRGVRNGKPYPSHCPSHTGQKHGARSARSVAKRTKKCQGWLCGRDFIAKHPSQLTCDECKTTWVDMMTRHGSVIRAKNWDELIAAMARLYDAIPRPVVAFDTEGFGHGAKHKQRLAVVGDKPLTSAGRLKWGDVFQFLTENYEPNTLYVSFFMDYDLGQLFGAHGQNDPGALPWHRAKQLLRPEAIRTRKSKYHKPFPVETTDHAGRSWVLDMLPGGRMLKFKRRDCTCTLTNRYGQKFPATSCDHLKHKDWFYLNDVRQFFNGPFTDILDDPTVGTEAERKLILEGKANRDTAELSEDTIRYTQAENKVLAEVVQRQDVAMQDIGGIKLSRDMFIGPGYFMGKWLAEQKVITADRLAESVPPAVLTAAQAAFYGGWTELICPGWIPGDTYQYDRNSAYCHIIQQLPCLEPGHGSWIHGTGKPPENGSLLRLAHVEGSAPLSPVIVGPFPYRNKRGRVTRPLHSSGWHWQCRIDSAISAGFLDATTLTYFEWWEYQKTCKCPPPMHRITDFWQARQQYAATIGPKSVEARLMRLLPSSVYGKFCQTAGDEPGMFTNPVYASLITAMCDSYILEAIRTHPDGQDAVIEIATDSVFFRTPHPGLEMTEGKLGAWKVTKHPDLYIFQRGMRWDGSSALKRRGIAASDIHQLIEKATPLLKAMHDYKDRPWEYEWPVIPLTITFSAVSLNEAAQSPDGSRWRDCGKIVSGRKETLNSSPGGYRDIGRDFCYDKRMNMFRTSPCPEGTDGPESMPYTKKMVREEYRAYEWGSSPKGAIRTLIYDEGWRAE